MGLTQVEVTLDGVTIMLQGVRIMRRADGLSYVEFPPLPTYGWLMAHGYLPH